ncbi:putative membrane protein [Psychrobacter luti]|uniref:Putative membrane protein n=1 Tax=Psychrobacter luti TaxID=198481 RepID=A0A839TGC6_9GAMM|nr:DUF2339 domain-containing protein [Psychrobacter luti]MBB3107476.1 putative membrane protein [Psychrobacter luti]
MSPLGWLAFIVLLIVVVVLYTKINRQIEQLRHDMTELQTELELHKDSVNTPQPLHSAYIIPTQESRSESVNSLTQSVEELATSAVDISETTFIPNVESTKNQHFETTPPELPILSKSLQSPSPPQSKVPQNTTATIEPDERSLPIVTSVIHSMKNWFFGGNLVVRVGVLVLLVGVVLLLRLLSDYIEIPITVKLMSIGIIGLGLAALGLKLAKNRFAYGITLQGAGLAIAYLTTFFAYSVYQVLASMPSFIGLGILSAITIGLAVRQNALPLALLALSGGFFAPILTNSDIGNLVTLFSYYLLLNVTIAVIAHYRTWKMLNLLGVMVTFGLAYYWGATENLSAVIEAQRWSLVLLISLHVLLYLFVVIRYAQQIIAYNILNEADFAHTDIADTFNSANNVNHMDKIHLGNDSYVFPIDTGLLFSVPILAFGLFAALLDPIPNALTITSAVLAVMYLGIGWVFVQRSQCYALITEGMLALGFGFLALVIPLALDAEWIAFGWSVQGLALVWFGRRSLRAWSVLFGLLLQLLSIAMLMINVVFTIKDYPTLALTISALSYLATMFILRASNSPTILNGSVDDDLNSHLKYSQEQVTTLDSIASYASALGISIQAAHQWLTSINSQGKVFSIVWRSPILIRFLTFTAIGWLLYVLVIDFDQWFVSWQLATTALLGLALLTSLVIYQAITHYHSWREIRQFSHGLLLLFYAMVVLQLPQKYEFDYQWTTFHWPIFITLFIGWLAVGQLWLRTWHKEAELKSFDSASWLGAGIILLAEAMHYGLPDSKGVMTILVPIAFMLIGLYVTYRHIQLQNFKDDNTEPKTPSSALTPYWFDLHQALLDSAKIFVPMTLGWAIFTNFTYDGVIWGLPYFPLFNLYDVTLWLVVFYGLGVYLLRQPHGMQSRNLLNAIPKNDMLLIVLALIGLWIGSSMLVRTLHAFIGTPLWIGGLYDVTGGAWNSEQVQTGLTILWTLIALVATIIASRYGQRTLWFMGIGLLGIVVLKLVLVDLSQTEAIWRVISFLGAGSLILVIGYLAPLPPAREDLADESE